RDPLECFAAWFQVALLHARNIRERFEAGQHLSESLTQWLILEQILQYILAVRDDIWLLAQPAEHLASEPLALLEPDRWTIVAPHGLDHLHHVQIVCGGGGQRICGRSSRWGTVRPQDAEGRK